jgi:hypothetical protein
MNASLKAMLLAAAGSGLMAGASTPLPTASPTQGPAGTFSLERQGALPAGFAAQTSPLPKHACKGQNSCKGQGGCSAGDQGCKGKNSCKGKGGCNTDM